MFVNERFPDAISYDAIERLRHSTSVIQLESGVRVAYKNWSFPLREFDVSHALRIKSYMDTVVAFNFAVAEGMANTFRYKAWGDFKAASGQGVVTAIDATTFQMGKQYTFGSSSKVRKVTLPVSGTVAIAGGGVYAVDYNTGIITKTSGADPTGWTGEFDVQACFGSDLAEYMIHSFGSAGGNFLMRNEQILLLETR